MHWTALILILLAHALLPAVASAAPADPVATCSVGADEPDFPAVRSDTNRLQFQVMKDYVGGQRVAAEMSDIHADWQARLEASGGFSCLDADTRRDAYLAIRAIALHAGGKHVLEDLSHAWNALDPDHAGAEAATQHRLLVSHRKFDEAAELRERFPEISAPLTIAGIDCAGCPADMDRTVLEPSGDGLVRIPVDMSDYTGLVVVGHPGCGFTRRMWEELEEYPELARAVREDAVWIADSWADLTPASYRRFQSLAPDMPFHIAWKLSDWPEIDYWGSPAIYAFRDGQVVGRHIGWPRGQAEDTGYAIRDLLSSLDSS